MQAALSLSLVFRFRTTSKHFLVSPYKVIQRVSGRLTIQRFINLNFTSIHYLFLLLLCSLHMTSINISFSFKITNCQHYTKNVILFLEM